jgi:hypothetical protein
VAHGPQNATLRSVRAVDAATPAALSLLDAAGFKTSKNASIPDMLELVHSNSAILQMVSQVLLV